MEQGTKEPDVAIVTVSKNSCSFIIEILHTKTTWIIFED